MLKVSSGATSRRDVLRASFAGAVTLASSSLAGCVEFNDHDVLPVADETPDAARQAGLRSDARLLPVSVGRRQITTYSIPAAGAVGTLVAFGGNGNSARRMVQVLAVQAAKAHLNLVVPSYYTSDQAVPTGIELRAMADAVYAAAAALHGPVYLLGYSLGCFIAIDLATRVQAQGLMLAAAGTTIAQTFGRQYFPLNLVVGYRATPDMAIFDASMAAARITMPTLIFTSDGDEAISPELSQRVFDALPAGTRKQFLRLHGVSHGAYLIRLEVWTASFAFFHF